uniref:Portal protein n=1 Tax=viral metagenome TaxID=1070528 RepID=A0A6M3JTD4_9ZZZZ
MPFILDGTQELGPYGDVKDVSYDYKYPKGLDLKPGSDLHDAIKNAILRRARASANMMNKRFSSWNEIDHKMTGYISTTQAEEDIKTADERKPVSIVFPYSYAIMETILAYMIGAFLREPILRYEGVGPEDVIGAILLEKVINVQTVKGKMGLALHTFFRDAVNYGMGIVAPKWKEVRGFRTIKKEMPSGMFGGLFRKPRFERDFEEVITFEGSVIDNIDPYKYLPDPNVPVHKIQDGEFVGWVEETNFVNLLDTEKWDTNMFNARYVRHVFNKTSSIYSKDESGRNTKVGTGGDRDETTTKPVDVIYMYEKLIPKDWKLGTSEYPEKWLFALASDTVLVKAQPLNLDHNMFPVAIAAPDFDGYTSTPISRMELTNGMQETLDWLFNSHIANVRKAINDMIIVDPYLVNMKDLKDPRPGALIRLRRPAWGRGVDKVAQQLTISDITRTNIADSAYIVQWMQKIGGSGDESSMGSLRAGGPERLTKAEFQGTRFGTMSRFERMAKMIGLQGMQDIGYMFASHTQQLMSMETYVKTAGRMQEDLEKEFGRDRIRVTPFDLLINYDVFVRDGSVPGGNFADVWVQMFKIIGESPELAKEFDTVRIFKHIARNLGAKNVDDFVRKTPMNAQLSSGENIDRQVSKGNLVPINRGAS